MFARDRCLLWSPTPLLLAPAEIPVSLDTCEWLSGVTEDMWETLATWSSIWHLSRMLCCTSNATRFSCLVWTTKSCPEKKYLPPALDISFSVGWGKATSLQGQCSLMPIPENTPFWWFKSDNLTLCAIPCLFLLELVWSYKSFRWHKSSQKITSE